MKILVCCGSGLGSSLMMEINIKKWLAETGRQAEVDHADLASASGIKADIYLGTRDIAKQLEGLGGAVISLSSMIDKQELHEKLAQTMDQLGG